MTWKTIAQIGMWSLAGFLLIPAGMGVQWIVVNCYHAWLAWKRDRIELEALRTLALARAQREQLVRLQPDPAGHLGVVFDQGAGVYSDLDTGARWAQAQLAEADRERVTGGIKQRMLTALSGMAVFHRAVREIMGDEEPPQPQIQVLEEGDWFQLEAKAPESDGEIEV